MWIWIGSCLLFILFITNKWFKLRESRQWAELFLRTGIISERKHGRAELLIVDIKNPKFSKIDLYLEQIQRMPRMHLLLIAPEWLSNAKRKKWNANIIFLNGSAAEPWLKHFSGRNPALLLKCNGGRVKTITETDTYLKLFMTRSDAYGGGNELQSS